MKRAPHIRIAQCHRKGPFRRSTDRYQPIRHWAGQAPTALRPGCTHFGPSIPAVEVVVAAQPELGLARLVEAPLQQLSAWVGGVLEANGLLLRAGRWSMPR